MQFSTRQTNFYTLLLLISFDAWTSTLHLTERPILYLILTHRILPVTASHFKLVQRAPWTRAAVMLLQSLYINYGKLHCDILIAIQDCSLSNDKLQLVFLRLCDVMRPKWSFGHKYWRRNISPGELTDLWQHLYCAFLRNLVSIIGSLRYRDYGLRLRINMLLCMIRTTWLFIFPA